VPAGLDVGATGMGGRMLPAGVPSSKPVQRRLRGWLALDAVRRAGEQVAQRSEAWSGIAWEEGVREGAKQPAKKGGSRQGRVPSSAGNGGRRCPLRGTPVPGR
jgi:hypothetical protein